MLQPRGRRRACERHGNDDDLATAPDVDRAINNATANTPTVIDATVGDEPHMTSLAQAAFGRTRRLREFGLGVHAIAVVVAAYILLALANRADLPPDLPVILGGILFLYIAAHLAVRRFAPLADATILPIVAMLNGIGFVVISRLDRAFAHKPRHEDLARPQAVWTAIGVALFIATLMFVRDIRVVARYRYTCAIVGVVLLLLPLAPSPIGRTINGARIWAAVGPISFQPGEAAKVFLAAFFAGYLVDARELLARATKRVAGVRLPDPRHFAPLLAFWSLAIMVLVFEKDLGSSLLQFCVFISMLYVATNRSAYLITGLGLFGASAFVANKVFSHVQVRVQVWLNPWPIGIRNTTGYQVIQSWYAFGNGGFAGTGLGLGTPDRVPVAVSDFIIAAIGEELGLVGTVAVIILITLLVGSGLRIAVDSRDPFSKLFVSGLTVILAVQTFVIVGGVTRLIPSTGVTLPFVSYGGSSLVANFVIVAIFMRVSDANARAGLAARR